MPKGSDKGYTSFSSTMKMTSRTSEGQLSVLPQTRSQQDLIRRTPHSRMVIFISTHLFSIMILSGPIQNNFSIPPPRERAAQYVLRWQCQRGRPRQAEHPSSPRSRVWVIFSLSDCPLCFSLRFFSSTGSIACVLSFLYPPAITHLLCIATACHAQRIARDAGDRGYYHWWRW